MQIYIGYTYVCIISHTNVFMSYNGNKFDNSGVFDSVFLVFVFTEGAYIAGSQGKLSPQIQNNIQIIIYTQLIIQSMTFELQNYM